VIATPVSTRAAVDALAATTPWRAQLGALVARNLRTTARVPQLLMFSLTMPMAMLVLFSQVFRSLADSGRFPAGVSYIEFVTPAMLAVSTVMAGTNVGVAAAIDHTNGLHARFATMPQPRWLPRAARMVNELIVTGVRAVLLVAAAFLLGFEFSGGGVDVLAAAIVVVPLVCAMSAVFDRLGDRLRRPDVVQFAGMMVMMPLMFVSSAFAPLETMPSPLRTAAGFNPVSRAIEALRACTLGELTARQFLLSLAASIGMWAVVAIPARDRP
jgi:ABC-2 type transport system permease protein